MIELNEVDLIGTGTRRLCYAYPGQLDFCIKIPKQTKNGRLQQRREIKYYKRLEKRQVPTKRITQYHRSVQTNLGEGYVYDIIRDAGGDCSLPFIHYLQNEPERVEDFMPIVKTLEGYFFKNRVLFYDLNPHNILCRRSDDNMLEPFVIDGIGDVVAITILNHSDFLLQKKIKRRWFRFTNGLKKWCEWMSDYELSHQDKS